jgi:hypothetical protein
VCEITDRASGSSFVAVGGVRELVEQIQLIGLAIGPGNGSGRGENLAGICQCGCGQQTTVSRVTDRRKGYLKGTPRRYVNGHGGAKSQHKYLEDEHGCWIWQRSRTDGGYGRVRDGKMMRPAHAVWYERECGPVPTGLVLHHICQRGHAGCMNPWHVRPVTPAENARLSRAAKLDRSRVAVIKTMLAAGARSKASIAREFGVSGVLIHYIVTGRCWSGP